MPTEAELGNGRAPGRPPLAPAPRAPPCGRLRPGALPAQPRRHIDSGPGSLPAPGPVLPVPGLVRSRAQPNPTLRAPLAGVARLGRCGRTARRAPCGAEPEARAWFPAGRQREECFRGLGRTCGDERGVASALAGGVREGCVRPAAERGAGRVGSAGSRTARPEGTGRAQPRPCVLPGW